MDSALPSSSVIQHMRPNAIAGPSSRAAGSPPPSSSISRPENAVAPAADAETDGDDERCCICLMGLVDRTVVGCGHQFCFKCIGVWANQSRRCPLCNAVMGAYLEHDLNSSTPTKFFLPPLPEPFTARPLSPTRKAAARAEVAAFSRRRDLYARGLWAKHVAANEYTGFRPSPSPADIASDGATAPRARTFLKRELRVWFEDGSEVDRVAEHITILLASVDIRSPVAVALLHPLLGSYAHAQHLAHELYAFLRSPFASLEEYDQVVAYDADPTPAFPEVDRFRRRRESLSSTIDSRSSRSWDSQSRGRSRSRFRSSSPRSRSPSHSRARSPINARGGDTFVPAPSRGERRWDQPDSWIDPEYERELAAAEKRRKRRDQRTRQRERKREAEAAAGKQQQQQQQQQQQKAQAKTAAAAGLGKALAGAGITIRGAAERRQSLLERLAQAKSEAAGGSGGSGSASPAPGAAGAAGSGSGTALLARISGAAADPIASASTTPPASKQEHPVNGASAESRSPTKDAGGAEERASELRARLIAERKRKVLREQLLSRKRARASPERQQPQPAEGGKEKETGEKTGKEEGAPPAEATSAEAVPAARAGGE